VRVRESARAPSASPKECALVCVCARARARGCDMEDVRGFVGGPAFARSRGRGRQRCQLAISFTFSGSSSSSSSSSILVLTEVATVAASERERETVRSSISHPEPVEFCVRASRGVQCSVVG